MNNIVISLDTDWASDFIIEYCINLLDKYSCKAVFFATNDSNLLKNLNSKEFEIGIHPNFNNSLNDLEKPIKDLMNIYPNSIGGRSHGLFVSSSIISNYKKFGLKYESNNFLFLHPKLIITERYKDFKSVPFFWSDDKYLEFGSKSHTHLNVEGLKVYNFHPIHIFLNTPFYDYYEKNKKYYHDHLMLKKNRFKGFGACDFFEKVLLEIHSEQRVTTLIKDLV